MERGRDVTGGRRRREVREHARKTTPVLPTPTDWQISREPTESEYRRSIKRKSKKV